MRNKSIGKGFVRGGVAGLEDYRRDVPRSIRLGKLKAIHRGDSNDLKSIVRKVASYQGLLVGFMLPSMVQQMVFDHAVNKALASKRLSALVNALTIRFSKPGKP